MVQSYEIEIILVFKAVKVEIYLYFAMKRLPRTYMYFWLVHESGFELQSFRYKRSKIGIE